MSGDRVQSAARDPAARRQRVLRGRRVRAGQEPRLSHQRDGRSRNRLAPRLLQSMMGNIEAYLACCQLGITMASLGLGWVGEPTVSALLTPVLEPLGMSERTLHFDGVHGRLPGVLLAAHRHRRAGAEDALAIRAARAGHRSGSPIRCIAILIAVLSAELAAQRGPRAGFCACSASRGASQHEMLTDSEIERVGGESAESRRAGRKGEAGIHSKRLRFGELAVSDVMIHRTNMVTLNADLKKPDDVVSAVIASAYTRIPLWRGNPENIIGILHVQAICCARCTRSTATPPRSISPPIAAAALVRAGDASGLRTTQGVPPPQDALRAGRRRVRRSRRAWSRWRTFSRRSSATSPTSTTWWCPACAPSARWLSHGRWRGADPRSQPCHGLESAGRGSDHHRRPCHSRGAHHSRVAARASPSTAFGSACCAASATASPRCASRRLSARRSRPNNRTISGGLVRRPRPAPRYEERRVHAAWRVHPKVSR